MRAHRKTYEYKWVSYIIRKLTDDGAYIFYILKNWKESNYYYNRKEAIKEAKKFIDALLTPEWHNE